MPDTRRSILLIVNHGPFNLDAIERRLGNRFKMRLVHSGQEALALLRTQPVAVVVTDQRMPDMTCAEFLATAGQLTPDVPGLVLTSYADGPDLIAAVNLGTVRFYLTKPWDPDELLAAVENVAEKTRRLQINRPQTAAGQIAQAEIALRDQLRHAEVALHQSHEKLELLFDLIPASIVVLDREGRVVKRNSALESMWATTVSDSGQSQYLRPDGSPRPVDELASTRAVNDN